jgi:hypothetical protein
MRAIKWMRMGRVGHIACVIISEAQRHLSTKTDKRKSFERPTRRRENNIKMDLIYFGGMWICFMWVIIGTKAVLNTVMNARIP